jgi:hypothetical protein
VVQKRHAVWSLTSLPSNQATILQKSIFRPMNASNCCCSNSITANPYQKPAFGIGLATVLLFANGVHDRPAIRQPRAPTRWLMLMQGGTLVNGLIDTDTTNGLLRRQRVQTRHDHKMTNGRMFLIFFDSICITLARLRRQFSSLE